MIRTRDDSDPLKVGLFTHSTHPRGGVVHAIELGEAMTDTGHQVVVHAPDESGNGFFRQGRIGQVAIPAAPVEGDLAVLVKQRVDEFLAHLLPRGREFDVYHSHDGISGNALATLVAAGIIPGFVRTVHHLDDFTDPYLADAQDRSVTAAARCICVSDLWAGRLRERYGIEAAVVRNGVDPSLFNAEPQPGDEQILGRVMGDGVAGAGPLFLAVGGVERRKNTVNILRAFLLVRKSYPRALLLIAGGASLLDHSGYRAEFDAVLAEQGPELAKSVLVVGPLPDSLVAASYRIADAMVFPSITEGFGLAVLEAMASGTPVVASRIPPFTEYLTDHDALLVEPDDVAGIARAMERAVGRSVRDRLRKAGFAVAGRFTWPATARAVVAEYRRMLGAAGGELHATHAISVALAG